MKIQERWTGEGEMKTVISVIVLMALAVAGFTAYNWLTGNNNVKIESPGNNSTVYTNSVKVQLSTTDKMRSTLSETANDYQIVTYVDNTEVRRGKELTYDLPNVTPGKHELKIAVADNRPGSINLSLQPGAVGFTVAPVAASPDRQQYSNIIQSDTSPGNVMPEATPIAGASNNGTQGQSQPAPQPQAQPAPQPTTAPRVASLPSAGMGGGQEYKSVVNVISSGDTNYASNAASFSTLEKQPVTTPTETPMQSAMRSLLAFYIAAFVVGLFFIGYAIQHHRNRYRRMN